MILRDQVIDTHIPRDDGAYADLHGAVVPFQVASSTLEAVSAGLMQEVSTVFAHAGFAKKDASTNIASVLLDYNGVGDEYSSDMRDVGYLLRMRRDPLTVSRSLNLIWRMCRCIPMSLILILTVCTCLVCLPHRTIFEQWFSVCYMRGNVHRTQYIDH